MGASDYAANKLLDLLNGKTAFTLPNPVAVALTTDVPLNSQTGATISEANYSGYTRKSTVAGDWAAGTGRGASNANALAFPANASPSAQTIKGFATLDSATPGAGNMLLCGYILNASASPKAVSGITRSGSTATVSCTAHGYTSGDQVAIAGCDEAAYNGSFSITVVNGNSFTFAVSGTPTTPVSGASITAQLAQIVCPQGVAPNIPASSLVETA